MRRICNNFDRENFYENMSFSTIFEGVDKLGRSEGEIGVREGEGGKRGNRKTILRGNGNLRAPLR